MSVGNNNLVPVRKIEKEGDEVQALINEGRPDTGEPTLSEAFRAEPGAGVIRLDGRDTGIVRKCNE